MVAKGPPGGQVGYGNQNVSPCHGRESLQSHQWVGQVLQDVGSDQDIHALGWNASTQIFQPGLYTRSLTRGQPHTGWVEIRAAGLKPGLGQELKQLTAAAGEVQNRHILRA